MDLVGDTDARREIPPVGVGLAPRLAVDFSKKQAAEQRQVGDTGLKRVGGLVGEAAGHLVMALRARPFVLPAHTQIQRDLG